MYPLYEFIGWVKQADEMFEVEGKIRKAFRLLKKILKHYDRDIPAYIYMKYNALWKAFEKEYEVDYEIEKMTDDELSARISDALQLNRSVQRGQNDFKRGAKALFQKYMQDSISANELKNRLSLLEKKYISHEKYTAPFEYEIYTIFSAYFYGRETISRKIMDLYGQYMWFTHMTFEDVWKKRIEKELEQDLNWPKPMKCAIQIDMEGKYWNYIYIDPTIKMKVQNKNHSAQDEDSMLYMFQSLIEFDCDPYYQYYLHENCRIISNWLELMKHYPELAETFVQRGKRYCSDRENYLKEVRAKKEYELLSIPIGERKQILRIWNFAEGRWISVVE